MKINLQIKNNISTALNLFFENLATLQLEYKIEIDFSDLKLIFFSSTKVDKKASLLYNHEESI